MSENLYVKLNDRSKQIFKTVVETYLETGSPSGSEKILQKGIDDKCANSILVKVNQVGSVTETINTMMLAKENRYTSVISHRSGETEDTFISHLCVGTSSGQIKTGAPARSERTAKYNELLRIGELVGFEKFNLQNWGHG